MKETDTYYMMQVHPTHHLNDHHLLSIEKIRAKQTAIIVVI